jgi:hypothetical protein
MNDIPGRPRRRLAAWQFYALLFAATMALVAVATLFDGVEAEGETAGFQPWLVAAILLLSGAATLLIWRRLDEAAREAHKWAWYWGGSAGLVAVLAMLMLGDRAFDLAADVGLTNSFESGITAVLLLQVIGYLIAWAWWWLRRR